MLVHQPQRCRGRADLQAESSQCLAHLRQDWLALLRCIDCGLATAIADGASVVIGHTASGQTLTNEPMTTVALGQTGCVFSAVGVAPGVDLICVLENFTANRAAFTELLPVVGFAVGFPILLDVTVLAKQLAHRAARAEQLIEVPLAVRFAITFVEFPSIERATTLRANEVGGVPGFAQGCRVVAGKRLVAVGTARAEAILVAGRVVWLSVVFVEALFAQWLPAARTAEAILVPLLIEGCDVCTGERLPAAGAGQFMFLQEPSPRAEVGDLFGKIALISAITTPKTFLAPALQPYLLMGCWISTIPQ